MRIRIRTLLKRIGFVKKNPIKYDPALKHWNNKRKVAIFTQKLFKILTIMQLMIFFSFIKSVFYFLLKGTVSRDFRSFFWLKRFDLGPKPVLRGYSITKFENRVSMYCSQRLRRQVIFFLYCRYRDFHIFKLLLLRV